MDTFIKLEDLNYVTVAINLRNVSHITLVHAGRTDFRLPGHSPFQPLINVVMMNGEVLHNLKVPTVDKGSLESADRAVWAFFARLEGKD